ncbi:MAG: uroporphyrinogen decarboxylase [Flavobacteriaceae bacterium CG_4_8_14_3_um_filter_34_10]|nr:MAG: uroporphyrinogen decarboxylase [Flavobacteriaceae bacterium CG2_30_34_30]PIQ18799.1 MAG: uroporphyrinogen decarboxylase [Flavobacteriaceae bacterium CG18_big_fil_WC_8_21_14_2_50_34_36]PIV49918.1 MAG: uroporphyrinogen decarboxylase [Flavobacteriaceae bacterium CG02_land_8_20_14_3_00_34_13]PIX08957.1 MAG: uroporphyrinogen decarboxylase [Flavobacteriaceae bacterium CG_4_8_14_3_um_filter_34_10]PIZ09123.1 MAG: uroporphyrinogen decarboxylase [Flavobacteriaceae bacterium CG_4_10_14_0_8_um_filt
MELFEISLTELVGYFASLLLVISFLMRNLTKLRIINSFGCIAFIIYGFMLQTSWPIIITNAFIVGVNFYYLFLKRK